MNYFNTPLKQSRDENFKIWFYNQVYLSLVFFLGTYAQMQIEATLMKDMELDKYNSILELDGYRSLVLIAIRYRDADDSDQPAEKSTS
jgi:nitroreductase/dihydropteridine reductase